MFFVIRLEILFFMVNILILLMFNKKKIKIEKKEEEVIGIEMLIYIIVLNVF